MQKKIEVKSSELEGLEKLHKRREDICKNIQDSYVKRKE